MSIGAGYIARGAMAGIEDTRRHKREDTEAERKSQRATREQDRFEYEKATRESPEDVKGRRQTEAERAAAEEKRKAELHGPKVGQETATAKKVGIEAEHAKRRAEMDDELAELELEQKQIALENAQAAEEIRKAIQGATTEAAKTEAANKVIEGENKIAGNIYRMYKRNPKAAVALYNESPISSATDAAEMVEYTDEAGLPRVKIVGAQGNTVTDKRGGEQDFALGELELAFNPEEWKELKSGKGLVSKSGKTKELPKNLQGTGTTKRPELLQVADQIDAALAQMPQYQDADPNVRYLQAMVTAGQIRNPGKSIEQRRQEFVKAAASKAELLTDRERQAFEQMVDHFLEKYYPDETSPAAGIEPAGGEQPAAAPPPGGQVPAPPPGFVLQ